jgi:ferric-dicitrate binding protein FerR (iron transport regulator)
MQDDWYLLVRYLSGECTAEEGEAARRWIESDPERRRLVDQLRAGWDVAPELRPDSSEWNTDAAWQRLTARTRARAHRRPLGVMRPTAIRPGVSRRWKIAAVAATVLLTVGGGVLLQRTQRDAASEAVVQLREIRTVAGQRALLTLGDGSRVVLGPASVLRYDSTRFGVSSRTLTLDGEGYFTVAHMPASAPAFIVQTQRGAVRDVGTAFNVRDFAGRPALEVVVSEGSVIVGKQTLVRGDLARVDDDGGMRVRRGVDVDHYIAWTSGVLVFDKTPLRDALPDLERWYDLDITLADASVAGRPVVATLREGAASSALDLLALTLNLRVERVGRSVTLYSKN